MAKSLNAEISNAELLALHQRADCLFGSEALANAIDQCAAACAEQIVDLRPLVLTVMNGGLPFAAELLKRWGFPLLTDYIHITRYDGQTQGGKNKHVAMPRTPLDGRHVVIVDDIFDEGLTLKALHDWASEQGAQAVTTIVLADKQHGRKKTDYQPDYVAVTLPDRYVYGFGMDYKGWMRNLNGIYAVAEQDLN